MILELSTSPPPVELRKVRESLGLTQLELTEALGLRDEGRTVRAWEAGHRDGLPFKPTGTTLQCFRYFIAIQKVRTGYEMSRNAYNLLTKAIAECAR